MAEDPAASSQRYRLPSLTDKGALARLAAIGASVLAIAVCFAFVGGWLSPGRLGEARFIDRFEQVNGVHPGFRRNHAKGVCIAGSFESNGQGVRLSKAAVFAPGRVPVTGRFSLAGGHPHVADGPTAVLAMALRFRPPGGQEWRTAMIDIPVFLVRNGEGLYEQLLATQPDPKTGKPDPAKMAAFTAAHPEFLPAMQLVKSTPLPSGFANASFNGLNAFRFVNAAGAATAGAMVDGGERSVHAGDARAGQEPGQELPVRRLHCARRAQAGAMASHRHASASRAMRPATRRYPGPAERERVDVGTLTIDHVETEAPGNCRDINFDPLVLPAGIEPSDDPILSARSATYSQSFTRREGEKKTPSAVQVPVGKGS